MIIKLSSMIKTYDLWSTRNQNNCKIPTITCFKKRLPTLIGNTPEFTPVFSGVRVTQSLVLCVCFVDRCLSFHIFFFLTILMCCLSFFYLRILITLWYLQTLLSNYLLNISFLSGINKWFCSEYSYLQRINLKTIQFQNYSPKCLLVFYARRRLNEGSGYCFKLIFVFKWMKIKYSGLRHYYFI